jgi:hypothetical protein
LNPNDIRFRPGWIAWNYLQWHTLDAPAGRQPGGHGPEARADRLSHSRHGPRRGESYLLPVLIALHHPQRGRCADQRASVISGPYADGRILAACAHPSKIGTHTMAESGGDVSVTHCDVLNVPLANLGRAQVVL